MFKGVILTFMLFTFFLPVAAQTEIVRVKLVSVYDGDTITVADGSRKKFKVRLIGIDAPELRQKFGYKSRGRLKKLLKSEKNDLRVEAFGIDRNKRILGRIFAGETDLNLELLQSGYAWFYDSPDLGKEDLKIYRDAFDTAKTEKRGLFANEEAEDPKEFRRKKRGVQKRASSAATVFVPTIPSTVKPAFF